MCGAGYGLPGEWEKIEKPLRNRFEDSRIGGSFMKLIQVLAALFVALTFNPAAQGDGVDVHKGLPGQFILINQAPGQPWNVAKPDSFERGLFEEIRRTLPTPEGSRVRVGVSFIFDYLSISNDAVLTDSLRRFLELARETDTPVCVTFSGEYWWQARPDLWNWWDPSKPGYDPANRENVEWSSWSPEDALKIAWLNWGRQIRILPPPNLLSPRYREACREKLGLLVPILVDWWKALPGEKKDLFVGLKISWESALGVNGFYYPNGNALVDQSEANDPKTGIQVGIVPSRGVGQIGYAAVKTGGIRSGGEITEADLAEVVRRHVEENSREAWKLGVPRDHVFTHCGGWKEGELLFDAAVNRYSSPGWSFYDRLIDPAKNVGVQRALKLSDAPCWAASEWLHQGADTVEAWRDSIQSTLADPQCRFLCIYNWSNIRGSTNAQQAIRDFVNGSGKISREVSRPGKEEKGSGGKAES